MQKTLWFSHDQDAKDDPRCMLLIDELGLEGYGIYWVLIETLRSAEPEYRYHLKLLGGLARKYNTTAQKMEVVVRNYELFRIENDEFFLSESLCERMLSYEQKKAQARIAAKIGVEKRRKKQEKQLKELSLNDSSERSLSKCSAITEQNITVQKRREENNTVQNRREKDLENFFIQKCKNAKNPSAYRASIEKMYRDGVSSVVVEFENFKKEKKRQKDEEEYEEFIDRTICYIDSSRNEIKSKIVKVIKKDNEAIEVITEQNVLHIPSINELEKATNFIKKAV